MLAPILFATLLAATATAADADAQAKPAWHTPRDAFALVGNTWYVGTQAITVLLVRGPDGAILIDTGVPKSADSVLRNIQATGAELSDIKLIVTSHAHLDHVGAIAQLKRATGARVLATAASRALLERGGKDDLHFGNDITYPPVVVDGLVQDGETVRVGALALTAHATPAHTPGSTSWTWNERAAGQDVAVAYVDSITAPGYTLVDNAAYPAIVDDFRRGFAAIRALPCDVLITPHPEASRLFERVQTHQLKEAGACKAYADRGEAALDEQIARQTH